jgi:hypothetical protein
MRNIRPDVRILFTSGYPPDTIRDRGLLEEGSGLMRKPLKSSNLAEMAWEVRRGYREGDMTVLHAGNDGKAPRMLPEWKST